MRSHSRSRHQSLIVDRQSKGYAASNRLLFEHLEPRLVLSASSSGYTSSSPTWFQSVAVTAGWQLNQSQAAGALAGSGASTEAAGELSSWIVRLDEATTAQLQSVAASEEVLASPEIQLQVVRGLGLPGQLLVQTSGTAAQVAAALSANPH